MDDVLIVGGGHTGLYMASELARQGLSVCLFDQKKNIGEHIVCTGIIGADGFEKFDLPRDPVVGSIQKIRFFSPSGNHFDYEPANPLAWIVDRTQFNRHFAQGALDHGAVIETQARVEKIETSPDEVRVEFVAPDGSRKIKTGRVLIIATGVQHKLLESIGLEPSRGFLGGAQIHLPFEGNSHTHIYVGREVAPGAFAWMVPLASGIARIGLLSKKNPAFYLKKLLDQIKPGWRDIAGEQAIDLRPVVDGVIRKSYANRVLVVGEAAGQIKTTTAGGIYYGFLGASIGLEVLQDAFKANTFTADALAIYDERWKKVMGEELRLGYYCRKIFAKFTDQHMEELFGNRRIREEILALVYREAEFDWHRNLIVAMLRLPSVIRHALKHPILSSELGLSLLFGGRV